MSTKKVAERMKATEARLKAQKEALEKVEKEDQRARGVLLTTKWNTGRQYAANGQLIMAQLRTVVGGYAIFFVDHSRGIDGAFQAYAPHTIQSEERLREIVMFNYDRYQYTSPYAFTKEIR